MARLAHSMRWVLITAFGLPVEPEANSSLATVSLVTRPAARSNGSRKQGSAGLEHDRCLAHARGRNRPNYGIGSTGSAHISPPLEASAFRPRGNPSTEAAPTSRSYISP